MKNIEKYYSEILAINGCFAVKKETGDICECTLGKCKNCIFNGYKNIKYEYCNEAKFDWLFKEYNPQVLDDVEREYLEGVIEPFKKTIDSVSKHYMCWYYFIRFFYVKNKGRYYFDLPFFTDKDMYKGMMLNNEYSLKDLGL